MKSPVRKRGCKCSGKKCTCGATWSYRLELGKDPRTGRRKQTEKGGFRTKAEAEAAYALAFTELMKGTYVTEKNVMFNEYAEQWLKLYEGSGRVRNSTVDLRRARINNMLQYFPHIKVREITKAMYQEMLNDLKKQGYARKTVSSVHETAKLMFSKAVELEIIISDPTLKAEVPVYKKSVEELEQEVELPEYLEKEELASFLRAAKTGQKNDYAIFAVLAYTGLRAGELCVLKWRDIDFVNHTISVKKTLYSKKGIENYELNPPKTKKSNRVIDVDPDIISELKAVKARQNVFKMEHKKEYTDNDFVFVRDEDSPPRRGFQGNFYGYPIRVSKIEKRMTALLKAAGLNEGLTPHSLRHTHTSLLAEAGVALDAIMERLGHSSDRVTREIYLHVTKTRKKEAAQKFSALMSGL